MTTLLIFLFTFFGQIEFPTYRQDTTYLAKEPYSVQQYSRPAKGATDYTKWVWCNTCHQHLPEQNGVLYDWDSSTHCITTIHAHQNGWTDDLPLDDDQQGVIILITLALLWCLGTTILDPQYKKILHNNRDSKYDDC